MAKTWHKVQGKDGFAIYRASGSRAYASYNMATGSFSSKMLPGNVPVEILERAPRTIRVQGEAWGEKVVRSYLEGERPVTHTIAYRGRGPSLDWEALRRDNTPGMSYAEQQAKYTLPADPNHVGFDNYAFPERARAQSEQRVAQTRETIERRKAGTLREYEHCDLEEIAIVELRPIGGRS